MLHATGVWLRGMDVETLWDGMGMVVTWLVGFCSRLGWEPLVFTSTRWSTALETREERISLGIETSASESHD